MIVTPTVQHVRQLIRVVAMLLVSIRIFWTAAASFHHGLPLRSFHSDALLTKNEYDCDQNC